MSEPLYQLDAYCRTFEARVVSVRQEDRAVELDRTAFFPGGGGQPHDQGELIMGEEVLTVSRIRREGDRIWHFVDGPVPVAGSTVAGVLDWSRRFQLMRTHTALHILCGVVWRDYRAQVTGGNMEPLRGRLDFELEALPKALIDEIESKLNAEVAAERPLLVRILPREEALRIPDLIRTKINLLPEGIAQIRTVEIVGLDLQADGGTHVSNTREVGSIRIAEYKSKGRINKRIRIELEA